MNKSRKCIGGILPALVFLLILLAVFAVPAMAAGPVITEQPTDQYTSSFYDNVYFTVKAEG